MKTSNDFLDAVKSFYGLKSDYQLARFLKITDSRVSFYRTGKSRFDEDTCILIANHLNLAPGYVMACVSAERTKSDGARKEWAKVARLLGGIAAVLAVVSILPLFLFYSGHALPSFELVAMAGFCRPKGRTLYIMLNSLLFFSPLFLLHYSRNRIFSLCSVCRYACIQTERGSYHDYARA